MKKTYIMIFVAFVIFLFIFFQWRKCDQKDGVYLFDENQCLKKESVDNNYQNPADPISTEHTSTDQQGSFSYGMGVFPKESSEQSGSMAFGYAEYPKEVFIYDAKDAGFTEKQAEFLWKRQQETFNPTNAIKSPMIIYGPIQQTIPSNTNE